MYEPTSEDLQGIKATISPSSWKQRVEKARKLERKVVAILKRIKGGESQEVALRSEVCPSQRSGMLRALSRYLEAGFEGLIDRRTPRERSATPQQRLVVETARRAAPQIPVERIIVIVREQCGTTLSSSTVKRVLKEAGLERAVGRPAASALAPDIRVEGRPASSCFGQRRPRRVRWVNWWM
jgi:hypothetical protein